jgi:hypothetical protein
MSLLFITLTVFDIGLICLTIAYIFIFINCRIENLKNKTESVDESKVSDAFYTRCEVYCFNSFFLSNLCFVFRGKSCDVVLLIIFREAEIAELEALVPEIQEKIQDTRDMQTQSQENSKEEETTTGFAKSELGLLSKNSSCSLKSGVFCSGRQADIASKLRQPKP